MISIPYTPIDVSMPVTYQKYKSDAANDIFVLKDAIIWPLQTKKVPLNICTDIPEGYFGLLVNRSSTGLNGLLVHLGVIDTHYTGVSILQSLPMCRGCRSASRLEPD